MADKKKTTRSTSSGQVKKEEKKETQKIEELRVQLAKLQEEHIQLKLDNEQRKLKNTSSLTTKRKEIARLLTAMRQVEFVTYAKNI